MIERKVWIQCEACQSHILVPNTEKGKRILCPMCNNSCTIPEQEAIPAEYNAEYEKKNQTLVDEFFSICPTCHTHYRFPHSMNKQEMLCIKCHTLFIPSFYPESSEKKVYYNTRNDKSITLYDQLKKNKVGNRLKGGISVCNYLTIIAKNNAKGKNVRILRDLAIIGLIFGIVNGAPYISSNRYLRLITILFHFFTSSAIMDGLLIYFRNMRSDSGTLGDFLTCFSLQGLKLEFMKLIYLLGYMVIFLIPFFFLRNPIIISICLLLGGFIITYVALLLNFAVFYVVDSENMSTWQCIQQSVKVMSKNIFYIVGASILSCIKTYFKFIAIALLIAIVGIPFGLFSFAWYYIGLLFSFFSLPIYIYWQTQNHMIYAIVYELTRD